jgi:LacI family transcriptional regulator
VSTVSYALNGGPRSVPEAVKMKVLEVARELNYRPNRLARSMVTGRSNTIGVVPPEVTENVFLSPYLQLALNSIANEAGRIHQDILLFTRFNETECDDMISVLVDGRVDGVIFIAPHFSHKTVEMATSLHLPCVAVSGAPVEGVRSYSVDNETGMIQAMEHLYALGHRKIAHIAGRLDMQDSILRLQAYQNFLRKHGLGYRDEYVAMGQFMISGGKKAAATLLSLQDPPTAILCANDEMAIGALFFAYEMGLNVPEDVSIVGFDMSPASANVYPPITTVRQPIEELGKAAVKALNELIEGRQPDDETVLPTELVVRSSTKSPRTQ